MCFADVEVVICKGEDVGVDWSRAGEGDDGGTVIVSGWCGGCVFMHEVERGGDNVKGWWVVVGGVVEGNGREIGGDRFTITFVNVKWDEKINDGDVGDEEGANMVDGVSESVKIAGGGENELELVECASGNVRVSACARGVPEMV